MKTKILIEVSSGLIQNVTTSEDADIIIIDHDLIRESRGSEGVTEYAPDCILKDGNFSDNYTDNKDIQSKLKEIEKRETREEPGKTKTVTLYAFSELSEEAKEKAIEKLSTINVDFEWWDATYEDAEQVKLKITGFDLDRGKHCEGYFMETATETAELIKIGHGKECETYTTATTFLNALNALTAEKENIQDVSEEEIEELEDEFLNSLCEDYRILLQKDFDYLTSKEAIIDSIEANGYTFTEDGTLDS